MAVRADFDGMDLPVSDLSARLDKAELSGLAVAGVATSQGHDTALFKHLTYVLTYDLFMILQGERNTTEKWL